MKKVTYNGHTYEIDYKKELSNRDYTQHLVSIIKSDNDNYPKSRKDIEEIMNDGSWNKAIYITRNEQQPSMMNSLHPYHEFTYNEELDAYVYTLVIPYDD